MRKQRRQPSFATLTDAEIEQLAQSLDAGTYADIRARINKPRSEGGFGLQLITDRPLEILWQRTKALEKINAHLATGQKLTLTAFDAITHGDAPASEEIHHAILFETMENVRSGDNTPAQLLTLQRLADFPERAALREQAAVIRAHREERQSEAHSWKNETHSWKREAHSWKSEMHTHKIALDLRKEARNIDKINFHQKIATERLDLQKRAITLREQGPKDHQWHQRDADLNSASDSAQFHNNCDDEHRRYAREVLASFLRPTTAEKPITHNASSTQPSPHATVSPFEPDLSPDLKPDPETPPPISALEIPSTPSHSSVPSVPLPPRLPFRPSELSPPLFQAPLCLPHPADQWFV